MPFILPAGQHYGAALRSWQSAAFTLSAIRYPPATKTPQHGNECSLLVFVLKGNYGKKIGRAEISCTQDTVLFVPAGWLQADTFGSTDTTCLVVDCSPSFCGRIRESGAAIREARSFSAPEFAAIGAKLFRELRQLDSVSGLIFESLILSALAHGLRRDRSSLHPRPPAWLMRAKDLLHDRFSESFTIESIASEVQIHPVHLAHEFRRFLRITPGEYLRRIRVEFAARQLAGTNLSMSEIALASGFADQSHFSKSFRRIMHLNPSEFRRLRKPPNSKQIP